MCSNVASPILLSRMAIFSWIVYTVDYQILFYSFRVQCPLHLASLEEARAPTNLAAIVMSCFLLLLISFTVTHADQNYTKINIYTAH